LDKPRWPSLKCKLHGAPSWNALARNNVATRGNASKKQMVLDWLGDEVETQRLRQEHTHHYLRWTLFAAIGAVIAILIAEGLTLLR
jgi:hypothetical protein